MDTMIGNTPIDREQLGGSNTEAIEVMRQQQQLLMKFQGIVVPLLRAGDPSAELVIRLLEDVIRCNICVISQLERGNSSIHDGIPVVNQSTNCRRRNNMEHDEQNPFSRRGRRNQKQSKSVITDAPYHDGHQWRKYGQKYIKGMQHPRCYYRCTYSNEQNCQATKTIQKNGTSHFIAGSDTTQYTAVYYGHHTCIGDRHSADIPCSHTMGGEHQNLFGVQEMNEDVSLDPELSALLNEFIDMPVDSNISGIDSEIILRLDQL